MALGDTTEPSTEPQVTSRNLDVTGSTDIQTPIWLTPESQTCFSRQNRGRGPATAPSCSCPHCPPTPTPTQSRGFKAKLPNSGPCVPSVPSIPTAPHPQPVGYRSWSGTCFLWTLACEHPSRPFPRPQPGDVLVQSSAPTAPGGRVGRTNGPDGARFQSAQRICRWAGAWGRAPSRPCCSSKCHGLPRGRENSHSQPPQFHRKPGTTTSDA